MNQIQKTLDTFKHNKKQIESMLNWTEEQYCWFQFEMMEEYINTFSGNDATALNLYGRSEVYRKWWVNQWNLRDMANIENMEYLSTRDSAIAFYKHAHHPQTLLESTVLATGESMIVGRVIDELHNQKNQVS